MIAVVRIAIVLLATACAKDAVDLYPFPCARDNSCPQIDELAGLTCNATVGCVLPCQGTTEEGCIDVSGNPVGDESFRCADTLDFTAPSCVRLCTETSECGPAYRCGVEGYCVLESP